MKTFDRIHNFTTMSTLEELNQDISELKEENRGLKEERKHAAKMLKEDNRDLKEERMRDAKILDLINTNTERLLEMERRRERMQQQQHCGSVVVNAAAVSASGITKGSLISSGTETFISSEQQLNPLSARLVPQQQQSLQHPLPSVPLDHSRAHIAQYDPKNGGYVTGTGSVASNQSTEGNYNSNGLSGPGVNGTAQSTGSVAYGGACGAQYEGEYYSAKRVANVPPSSSAPPIAQTLEVKVVSSTDGASASSGFDYDAVRAQYGNGYSAKRV